MTKPQNVIQGQNAGSWSVRLFSTLSKHHSNAKESFFLSKLSRTESYSILLGPMLTAALVSNPRTLDLDCDAADHNGRCTMFTRASADGHVCHEGST